MKICTNKPLKNAKELKVLQIPCKNPWRHPDLGRIEIYGPRSLEKVEDVDDDDFLDY